MHIWNLRSVTGRRLPQQRGLSESRDGRVRLVRAKRTGGRSEARAMECHGGRLMECHEEYTQVGGR